MAGFLWIWKEEKEKKRRYLLPSHRDKCLQNLFIGKSITYLNLLWVKNNWKTEMQITNEV